MVVVDNVDRFVRILGAVWTVGSYVGLTSLVCISQIHEGCEFFWACLNHPGAGPNSNSMLYIHPLIKGKAVVKYLVIFGRSRKGFFCLGDDGFFMG